MDLTACKISLLHKIIPVIVTLIIIFILKYFGDVFLPFIIGLVFAILIRSFVKFIVSVTGMNFKISAGICTAVCYAAIIILIYFAVRAFIGEVIRLFDNLPQLYEMKIVPTIEKIKYFILNISNTNSEFEKMITSFLSGAETELAVFFKTLSGNAAEKFAQLLLKIPDLFVTITVTVVASFFISIDYSNINNFFLSQLSEKTKNQFFQIKTVFFSAISKTLFSYFIIFLITFAELAVGLFLLKVKYALVFSLIIAVADIFPVIGTGTILIPWSIVELLNANKPFALGLFVLYLIISIVRNIIEPKIIGKKSGIHPVATLVAMYAGLKLGGMFFAVLLPFILIVLKDLNDKGIVCIYRNCKGSN